VMPLVIELMHSSLLRHCLTQWKVALCDDICPSVSVCPSVCSCNQLHYLFHCMQHVQHSICYTVHLLSIIDYIVTYLVTDLEQWFFSSSVLILVIVLV